MKILHVVHQYLPEKVGGTELYTQTLAQYQVVAGHDVSIFTPSFKETSVTVEDGIRVCRVNVGERGATAVFGSTFANTTLSQAFAQQLAENRPDLVHIEHLMGVPTNIVKRLQQHQIPCVITLWDFWWVCANAQLLTNYDQTICEGPNRFINCARCALARADLPQLPLLYPLLALPLARRNRLLRQVLQGANRLFAPAEFVRDWYVAYGAPAEKIVVVPPGLDYPEVMPRRELSVERPFRVGYIGGLSWQKGVHTLVDAFQSVENGELWIAGDTEADPDYVAQLKLKVGGNTAVNFLGKLDRDAIWQLMAQLDVIVVTSIWYETFCFVISEAFAAGVPVIAYDLGVIAERIQHNQDGILLPVGDSQALAQTLQQLQQQPDKIKALQANIQPVPTMQQHAQAIEQQYQQVVRSL